MEGAMSAMPAIELTCGSDIRPARVVRPVGALSGFREDEPDDAPGPQPDTPASWSGRQRDTPVAPLRLTRRGRVVAAAAAALLVTVVSLLVAGVAQATNHGPSGRAARQDLVQVVVHPGQSLWSVAESADPGQDTRAVIQQIIDLNSLNGDTVFAGQQLWVPRG
jgi:hypothetical protein